MNSVKFDESEKKKGTCRFFHSKLRQTLSENLCQDEYICGIVKMAFNYGLEQNDENETIYLIDGICYNEQRKGDITWSPFEIGKILSKLLSSCTSDTSELVGGGTALHSDLNLLKSLQKHVLQLWGNEDSANLLKHRPHEIILEHATEVSDGEINTQAGKF